MSTVSNRSREARNWAIAWVCVRLANLASLLACIAYLLLDPDASYRGGFVWIAVSVAVTFAVSRLCIARLKSLQKTDSIATAVK